MTFLLNRYIPKSQPALCVYASGQGQLHFPGPSTEFLCSIYLPPSHFIIQMQGIMLPCFIVFDKSPCLMMLL